MHAAHEGTSKGLLRSIQHHSLRQRHMHILKCHSHAAGRCPRAPPSQATAHAHVAHTLRGCASCCLSSSRGRGPGTSPSKCQHQAADLASGGCSASYGLSRHAITANLSKQDALGTHPGLTAIPNQSQMTGTLTCLGAAPQHHNLKQVRMHAGHCDSHAVGVCGLRLLLALAQRLAASPLPQLPGPAAAAWAPAAGRGGTR